MKRLFGTLSIAALLAGTAFAATVSAQPFPGTITIEGATSAEGIASGAGTTFYAGDLFKGDIYRGDLRSGETEPFIDAPTGRNALGLKLDIPHDLLFVAGGFTGQGYVYDASTGADVAVFQFGAPGSSIINDVTIAGGAAWFTDSVQAKLYRVPINADGSVGAFSTLAVTGPASTTAAAFNMNGIAADPNGKTLFVAHSGNGAVYTVDPTTGVSAAIAGADALPAVDGILFEGARLYAVQNSLNQISVLPVSPDRTRAFVESVITDSDFETPTTVARFGSRLVAVNAKFNTGFPPAATSYEAVIVDAH